MVYFDLHKTSFFIFCSFRGFFKRSFFHGMKSCRCNLVGKIFNPLKNGLDLFISVKRYMGVLRKYSVTKKDVIQFFFFKYILYMVIQLYKRWSKVHGYLIIICRNDLF